MKKKLYILMAYSGAGKTEIAKHLETKGYNVLQSYTTRQPRYENEYGHMFCTAEEYEEFKSKGEIAAYSLIEGNHYFSTKNQLYNTDIYVCDPDGIVDLKQKTKDIEFITIYIKVDKSTRIKRMQKRGDSVDKILSRITQDGIKFRDKKFDYKVVNYDFDKAVKIIEFIIKTENEEV
ncbi:Guanylate kinase [Paenibacillus sophorae]|uniref:AAA family ATPase n=1 Tax=Paenibacillus sophorae TaxID=1333845 RepID=A0A1H8GU90_9BACL|nr:AAA family ATPase [Paenibacillus sophorae]QWU14329.1 AAA family ATPase [Paenibacillus sophorae]SEN47047.1 Guanylate kinase [Paenibacillus sophorae]